MKALLAGELEPSIHEFQEGGLRRQLMRLALGLSGIGVVLLLISLVTTIWLQFNADHLASIRGPAVVSVQKAQLGLQSSLANLRGWVLINDNAFLDKRRLVWQQEIEPTTKLLMEMTEAWTDKDKALIKQVVTQLAELKESQWWVEDIAVMEGNEPAKQQLRRQVEPMLDNIVRAANSLQQSMANIDQHAHRKNAQFGTNLLLALSSAQKHLQTFTITGESWAKSQFEIHQNKVNEALTQISSEQGLITPLEQEYLQYVQTEWHWYQHLSKQLIKARLSERWNAALQMMASETVPIARDIEQSLGHLADRQLLLMENESAFVQTAGTVTILISVVLIILLALLAYILADHKATQITKPIVLLSAATRDLVNGALQDDLPVTSFDEIGALTAAFNKMRTNLQLSEAALKTAHQRMTEELEHASAYVQSILPEKWNEKNCLVRTDWQYIASSELGGDLFGYEYLADGKVMIYLLDVTGHGIGASLLSVSANDTLRRQTLPNTRFDQPDEVLTSLNNAFPIGKNNGRMFTIWYAVYDPVEKRLTYSSGGHHPSILVVPQNDGTVQMVELTETNLMIGVMTDYAYEGASYLIQPGTKLYLFSDCAYEVRNENGEMLGIDGIKSIIETVNVNQSENRLQLILDAVSEFDNESTFFDDYSMVEVEFV